MLRSLEMQLRDAADLVSKSQTCTCEDCVFDRHVAGLMRWAADAIEWYQQERDDLQLEVFRLRDFTRAHRTRALLEAEAEAAMAKDREDNDDR